jgi:ABC-type nitrate/sulfonate/bicarbonate transport system permease component
VGADLETRVPEELLGAPGQAQARTEIVPIPPRARIVRALAPHERMRQVALFAVVLGAWELAGRHTSSYTFAPPSSVVPAARQMLATGELQHAMVGSLTALLSGFALAAVVGIGVGYSMGWWRAFGRTLDPFVSALYVVPVAALVPAVIVWLGLGFSARVLVIFLFSLFEILLSAYSGVKNVDPQLVDVARTFGAGRGALLRRVVLPATLPFVFTGLRMGASRAVKGMVLAEMLFAVTGLGGLIIHYTQAFRMDRVFVAIIVIVIYGLVLTALVQGAERWALRWRR